MDLTHGSGASFWPLVISNIGVIGSLIYVAFKVTWWISKLEARVDSTKALAVRAHQRIDKIEDKIN